MNSRGQMPRTPIDELTIDMTNPIQTSSNAELEAELEAFNALCARLAEFGSEINSEMADGMLTAFAVAPLALPLSQQVQLLFGGAFERCFADPDDSGQAMLVLSRRQQVLMKQLDAQSLLDDPTLLRMQPLMQEWDDAARSELLAKGEFDAEDVQQMVTGAAWSIGFFFAVEAMLEMDDVWPLPVDAEAIAIYEELTSHVFALSFADDSEDLAEHLAELRARHAKAQQTTARDHAPPTRDELIDEACGAVQDLRIWWLAHGPKPAPRVVSAKLGRNEVCFCGSGKKYKKCHGAA